MDFLFELTPFVEACGLKSPIDLRITHRDGDVLAEGILELPCALVGRDPTCEVTLLDTEICLRQACLQAVGGRVLVADISGRYLPYELERNPNPGPERQRFFWLTPTDPVHLGPFRISLRKPLFVRPRIPETSPFLPEPNLNARLPRVAVRFLNGKSVKAEWMVNRLITFIGRSQDCKINLTAEDIALFHAYFVLTPVGLWIVDLLSRDSIRVNGEAVRYAHLKGDDTVQIGRFRLGFHYYEEATPGQPIPSPSALGYATEPSGFTPLPFLAPKVKATPPQPEHRADSVTPHTPIATPGPQAPPEPDYQKILEPLLAVAKPQPISLPQDQSQAKLVEQFSRAQTQMLEQFQQSMLLIMKMFGEIHREHMSALQAELSRMSELNAEMQKLQDSLALLTPAPRQPSPSWAEIDLTQPPSEEISEETARQYQSVYGRLAELQVERQTLWQRLFGMVASQSTSIEPK